MSLGHAPNRCFPCRPSFVGFGLRPQHKTIGKTNRKYLSGTSITNYPVLTISTTRFVTTKVKSRRGVSCVKCRWREVLIDKRDLENREFFRNNWNRRCELGVAVWESRPVHYGGMQRACTDRFTRPTYLILEYLRSANTPRSPIKPRCCRCEPSTSRYSLVSSRPGIYFGRARRPRRTLHTPARGRSQMIRRMDLSIWTSHRGPTPTPTSRTSSHWRLALFLGTSEGFGVSGFDVSPVQHVR